MGEWGMVRGDTSSEYRRCDVETGGGSGLSLLDDFRGGIGGGNLDSGTVRGRATVFRAGDDDFERAFWPNSA